MPAHRKGARLYLREERRDASGRISHPAVYVIRESGRGGRTISTGCGPGDLAGAELALHKHLGIARIEATARQGARAPTHIFIADVLALYAREKMPLHARPKETAARIKRLNTWWGTRRLSDVNGENCRTYVRSRSSPQAARRELEELRAAIYFHRKEGLCSEVVEVVLPERNPSRQRWCTRSEIARLIWAAWRYREIQNGKPTDRRSRRHVARFILVGVYTGTRAGAICAAALGPAEGRGWIDLKEGIFYRRPAGERETKKRRTPVRIPQRLLSHLRRWKKNGQRYAVQFNGEPVKDVDKAFRKTAIAAKLPDVTPHVLRHTSATWLMQLKVDKGEAAEYLAMTEQTLNEVYGHHHPDHLLGPRNAFDRPATARKASR